MESLKQTREYLRGCRNPLFFIRIWRRPLRWAWQRAWRGYDDVEVCNFDVELLQRIPILLRDFKRHNSALILGAHGEENFSPDMTEEDKEIAWQRTNELLDSIIAAFEACDENKIRDELLSTTDPYQAGAAYKELDRKRQEALALLGKWIHALWF